MQLIKMNEPEFETFLERSIIMYAQSISKSREVSTEEGLKSSREQFESIMKDKDSGHYFFNITNENKNIGWIWINEKNVEGRKDFFIYDIFIEETERGKGLGEKSMICLESKVKELGGSRISLHVFGYNSVAINLYKKCGYEITNLHMRKKI